MNTEVIKGYLKNIIEDRFVEEDVPMAQYTSFKAGGNTRMMITPQSIEAVSYTHLDVYKRQVKGRLQRR